MTKKSYNLTPNPHGKLKEGKSNNDPLKQVVYLRGENNELRFDIQAVKTELVRKSAIAKEYKEENKALRESWQELLIFAKEHDAGKSLYVEASEFIDYMNKLEAGG